MKHILFFITSLQYGGAERVVSNLSRSFAETGRYRVSLTVLEDVFDYPVSGKVRLYRFHRGRQGFFRKASSLFIDPFRLKKFVAREDVDIVLSFMQRPNAITMLAKAFGSKHRSCVNVRCSMTEHYTYLPWIARIAGRFILRRLWRYADLTITNSRIIKDEVISVFRVDPRRVEVIYNPIDVGEIEIKAKEGIADEPFGSKDPVIINVGRFARAKGHTHLLRAFAHLVAKRPAHLVLIGDGKLKKDIIREAEKLNISDKVYFMGWQPNPYRYLSRSSVFVLSSIYEGFPNVVLEAMACRLPVVAFDCISGPSEILLPREGEEGDIVRAQYGVLVKKRFDDKVLSQAIEDILNDSGQRARYAAAGFERAREFDLSRIAGVYEDILFGISAKERKEENCLIS